MIDDAKCIVLSTIFLRNGLGYVQNDALRAENDVGMGLFHSGFRCILTEQGGGW